MKLQTIVAIVLIVAGTIGLGYGGFTLISDRHTADLGSVQLSMNETRHINVPVWMGVLTIVAGGILLVWRKKT